MMKRMLLLPALAATAALALIAMSANAADHRDAPSVEDDPSADITDVYAFRSPANNDNLVIYLGVNGLTAPAETEERNFATDVTYSIHVDGDADLVADASADITFSGDPLTFSIAGLGAEPITGPVTPPGEAEPAVTESGGIKVFAGSRDDPFFFDLTGFKNFVAAPSVPAEGLRPAGETPTDAFEETNVSAIVIELPITALTGAPDSSSGTIKAWATTVRGSQVDRMAIPAINTALIPSGQKDAFNQGDPADDVANFQATAQTTIEGLRAAVDAAFGSPQDGGPLGDLTPAQVAGALIPDVVTIDFAQPVQFPNGRQLEDDVIDAALGVVLNRGGAAGISDAIDGNDRAFLAEFPYLAAPHAAPAAPAPTATTVVTGVPSTGGGDSDGTDIIVWLAFAAVLAAGAALLGGGAYLRSRR